MDWKEYMPLARRTCVRLPTQLLDDMHYTMGMVTEVGELLDVFKKHLAYGKPIDWVNVKEEVGDFLWYLANFCYDHNIDLEQVMATNIAKLKARYPDKFTSDKAINRDLDTERKILES